MLPAIASIPDFVWRARHQTSFGVPLLMFHWLAPDTLAAYLRWLRDAGYRSLTADEVASVATGETDAPSRAVALTFDDGVYNNWAVVAPLLREYGFHGIAFVVPLLLTEGPLRPTLTDVRAGRVGLDGILDDEAAGRYLRWSEVEVLSREGTLEIQSHTYDHARVFTADHIIDFQHPDGHGRPRYPWLWSAAGASPGEPLWGAPVYPSAPRLASRRYYDDPGFREACQHFVAIRGERGFLADETWRAELTRFATRERSRFPDGRIETDAETHAAQLATLVRGREALTERLSRPIEHVAVPWSQAGPDTPALIRTAGYRSGYTRERPSERLRRGDDPCDLARLEGYWVQSLPGEARLSLSDRVSSAIRRRLGRAHP